ncbi:hypothetical protein ACFYTQ_16170 [Nocardia sp. NPDC004068]|uniref:hypothetical protein n=1 Tax=Nocardia sp. NPDC004068 TaxID=3364303 RepID=UPI00368EDF76
MFGSGFLALAGWMLCLVWRRVREGLRGFAAVPWGYRSAVVAVGGFVVSGLADIVWHARFGEARGIAIVFAPGHLGLTVSMLVLATAPLRSAVARTDIGDAPPLRLLWPALLTTGLAASLVMVVLDYGNAITYSANRIVDALSATDDDAPVRELAAVLITATILLFLARRWRASPSAPPPSPPSPWSPSPPRKPTPTTAPSSCPSPSPPPPSTSSSSSPPAPPPTAPSPSPPPSPPGPSTSPSPPPP